MAAEGGGGKGTLFWTAFGVDAGSQVQEQAFRVKVRSRDLLAKLYPTVTVKPLPRSRPLLAGRLGSAGEPRLLFSGVSAEGGGSSLAGPHCGSTSLLGVKTRRQQEHFLTWGLFTASFRLFARVVQGVVAGRRSGRDAGLVAIRASRLETIATAMDWETVC